MYRGNGYNCAAVIPFSLRFNFLIMLLNCVVFVASRKAKHSISQFPVCELLMEIPHYFLTN